MQNPYANIYIYGFTATAAIILASSFYFYTGINEVSYLTYSGTETVTYYLDKYKYDLYFNGLIYCLSFGMAFLLVLGVILIPNTEQLQRRASASPYSAQLSSAPQVSSPLEQAEYSAPMESGTEIPNIAPNLGESSLSAPSTLGRNMEENSDEDVIYGTGNITDQSQSKFLLEHTDSAIKFLVRKELDGRPLNTAQEALYESWQKRGLYRSKLRTQVCELMGWEKIPNIAVNDIYDQIHAKLHLSK